MAIKLYILHLLNHISVEEIGHSPPAKIKLVLSESAKKHPPSLGGQYLLQEGSVNDQNHWVHQCGHSAIWWNDEGSSWCVGVFEKLGSKFAGIVGPYFKRECPTLITDGWKYSDGNHWIDAEQEDIQFLDFDQKEDSDPPLKLKLQLSGEAKNVQWKRAGPYKSNAKTTNGIYHLCSKEIDGYQHWKPINGYPYWIHENQNQAIWFNKISKAWFIGDIEDLGENVSGISGKFPIFNHGVFFFL